MLSMNASQRPMNSIRYEKNDNALYCLHDVPAGGNCFFYCLSQSLHDNYEHTQRFGHLICQKIVNEWKISEKNVKSCHGDLMSLDQYKSSMLNGRSWAGASEIEAASVVLQCKIHVFLKYFSQHDQQTS